MVGNQRFCEHVAGGSGSSPITGAQRAGRNHRVLDFRTDCEREVGRQCPRSGGPRQQAHTSQLLKARLPRQDREGHGQGLVLTILVDLVVHAQLVVGKRSLTAPAECQHLEALVNQTLVV